jgi:hypothetical protein
VREGDYLKSKHCEHVDKPFMWNLMANPLVVFVTARNISILDLKILICSSTIW